MDARVAKDRRHAGGVGDLRPKIIFIGDGSVFLRRGRITGAGKGEQRVVYNTERMGKLMEQNYRIGRRQVERPSSAGASGAIASAVVLGRVVDYQAIVCVVECIPCQTASLRWQGGSTNIEDGGAITEEEVGQHRQNNDVDGLRASAVVGCERGVDYRVQAQRRRSAEGPRIRHRLAVSDLRP